MSIRTSHLVAAHLEPVTPARQRLRRLLHEIRMLFGAPPFAASRPAPHRSKLLLTLGQNAALLLSRCNWRHLRQPLLLLNDSECGGCDVAAVCTSNSLPPKTTAAASRSITAWPSSAYNRRASSSLRSAVTPSPGQNYCLVVAPCCPFVDL